MRVGQLYSWLGQLLEEGMDKDIPVCITNHMLPTEVDRAVIASGLYYEDASPGYAGCFMRRDGMVIVLLSGVESREQLAGSHRLSVPEPEVPEKSWSEERGKMVIER